MLGLFLDLYTRVARPLGQAGLDKADAELAARETVQREFLHLEKRIDKIVLVVHAMWTLMGEKTDLTETELLKRVTELDGKDGAIDGRVTKPPVPCPKCGATICHKFNRCLFCGQEYAGGSAFDTV